ncbi:L-threonine 3-dehydrogenase [Photobacterium damselae subsp. damselae]|nr:L-threonine 3-dehydrogenase [Photobacterium damselae]UJZ95332.1 L-threonine 3-dehydrogenase [Photobacterium damselae subsp. damselae]UJZ99310.1 L-threonine 3-dehydrogenase [Photobacterium damselae subsp. damselae]
MSRYRYEIVVLVSIITHHYKIDDFGQGFDAMRSGLSGKVILDWE